MRILAVALADRAQRFVKGYPPKGAWFFLTPNLDISRLAQVARDSDSLSYLDLRVAPLEVNGNSGLVIVHVDFGQSEAAREAGLLASGKGLPCLFFGPEVTARQSDHQELPGGLVIGDIVSAWPALRQDAMERRLQPVYRAPTRPEYCPPLRPFGRWPEMNTTAQATRFIVGCHCSPAFAAWCRDRLYYGSERLRRRGDEVVGEILSMPGKNIALLDDDVAADPGYYEEVFRHVRHFRRYWTVRAGPDIFRYPRFIRLLAKSGVRMVFLNEDFLDGHIESAARDGRRLRELYRCVKTLQSSRMLVGARVPIRFNPEEPPDFEPLVDCLRRIDVDLVEPRFLVPDGHGGWRPQRFSYRPMLTNREPGWLSNRFYAMSSIINRLVRRPRRTGFYTTARYLLPYSLAYREDFLEGLPGD